MPPSPLPGLKAVVFDLDGTLIDSMPLVLRAFAYALEPFRPDLSEQDVFLRLGGPPERTLTELIGSQEGAREAMRRLETFGFSNSHGVQPFAGMREMLMAVHERGLGLAVWTGRDRATTEEILRTHGLGAFFAVVVCGDDFPTHKPHPGGMREILRRLAVSPGEVLFAGDADADVLGGAEAGVRTLLIRHGRSIEVGVVARVWRTVDTPADAYQIVRDCAG